MERFTSIRFARVLTLLVVLALGYTPALARAKEYAVQSWRSGYGLEARGLDCCAISQDGTVWIGAIGDLIRFDGLRFTRVPFALGSSLAGNRITALWIDDTQHIWCGYDTGEVVDYNRETGRATLLPLKWERQAVRAINKDPKGNLWLILDDHSLVRVRDGWTTGARNIGGGLRFLTTASGKLLAERSGGVYEWQPDGKWRQIDEKFGYMISVFPSSKGGIWLTIPAQERAFRVGADGLTLESRILPPEYNTDRFLNTRAGDLLAAVDGEGIVCMGPDGSVATYGVNDGLASRWVLQMAEDANGNIVAISSDGVSVMRPTNAEMLKGMSQLGDIHLLGVTGGDDGAIWIATEGKGVFRYSNGRLESFNRAKGLSNPNVWSILDAGSGGLWIGSWGGGLELEMNGRVRLEEGWDLKSHSVVTALLRSSDGAIWAGTSEGIGRKENGRWTWDLKYGTRQIRNVRCLATGGKGRIWFGTNGQGAGYIQGSDVRFLDPFGRMSSRFVNAIHDDGSGGLWIGTEGSGLYDWRDGRWTHLRQRNGLPCDDVFHIDDDGRGRLWFTSSVGVYSVRKDSLETFISGRSQSVQPLLINNEDGLPSIECTGGTANAAFLDSKGDYYVPTTGGMAVIDTRNIRAYDAVLCPMITQVTLDGRTVAVPVERPLISGPNTQSIRVHFTASTLTHASLVEFAYRLDRDGATGWAHLGQTRDLLLQRMSPGLHRLEIRAGYPGALANGSSVTLEIRQMPTLAESVWFKGLLGSIAVAGLVLIIWSVVRRRYLRERRQLELESVVEKERRRIARDIHDELGARLTQVMFLSQVGDRHVNAEARGSVFARIHATAKTVTKALDELVWAVNPAHDTIEGFALYVARIAQETITEAGLHCRLRIPRSLTSAPVNSGARHHLILCMKEAIANAIKHGSCRQIEVRLEVTGDRLRMVVSDDGCGFDVAACVDDSKEDPVHSGCRNMRERMREINGSMTLVSSPGKGTEVTFDYTL